MNVKTLSEMPDNFESASGFRAAYTKERATEIALELAAQGGIVDVCIVPAGGFVRLFRVYVKRNRRPATPLETACAHTLHECGNALLPLKILVRPSIQDEEAQQVFDETVNRLWRAIEGLREALIKSGETP